LPTATTLTKKKDSYTATSITVLEGREAVRNAWAEVIGTPGMSLTEEESFVTGDRAVVRWCYAWGGSERDHVRGVDVIRFRDGLVSEKLSYVKG